MDREGADEVTAYRKQLSQIIVGLQFCLSQKPFQLRTFREEAFQKGGKAAEGFWRAGKWQRERDGQSFILRQISETIEPARKEFFQEPRRHMVHTDLRASQGWRRRSVV
jgi:hypothetical protein